MTHAVFETRNGRHLGITGHGDPLTDRFAIVCHPVPGSGAFDPDPTASNASRLHLIGIDRPGYGASDPYAGSPRLEQWIDDVREYIDDVETTSRRVAGLDMHLAGFVGVGEGCFFAAALAATAPVDGARLVLVAPALPPQGDEDAEEAAVDPALAVEQRIDPMSGLLDRRQMALDAGDGPGPVADRQVLAEGDWRSRLHRVGMPSEVFAGESRDDIRAARWWRRRLPHARVHHGFGTGIALVGAIWGSALDALA